ncbi:ryncolin-2-like [Asterias rubens]|uniref:ryncolin-2-like n=1 Tax=Asterias rubens TaxID=7604 RepID=UPI0014553D03|nr:ryncolin-2-like [Asterias rubens]
MKVIITSLFLACLIHHCQSDCQQRVKTNLYPASNRVLLNHVFKRKTASSPLICGRDCSMDPHCASFNYYTCSHVCQLSSATQSQSPDDFIELQGVAYYDDNLETPSFSAPDSVQFSSCLKLYLAVCCQSDIYTIYPAGLTDGVRVYCDMETDGGGWIVFQSRQDGSVDFNRLWTEYQSGFGDLSTEFWLGNDILRDLTKSGQWQIRFDLGDWEGSTSWARYDEFAVHGDKYTLQIGSYDADSPAGDTMLYHDGQDFTTKDQDNDGYDIAPCARRDGAWWFKDCADTQLNDHYYLQNPVEWTEGLQWNSWKGLYYSLKNCSMKIREVLYTKHHTLKSC